MSLLSHKTRLPIQMKDSPIYGFIPKKLRTNWKRNHPFLLFHPFKNLINMIVKKFIYALLALSLVMGINYLYMLTGQQISSWFTAPLESTAIKTANISGVSASKNKIKVALLLDTSGSMSGLIEQAKSQLWNILNELSRTHKDGEEPELEIALYEYGNTIRTNHRSFQINQLNSFTTDMDLISEKLFALTTNGGEEYCGAVIQTSLDALEWQGFDDDLRIIYIAGNEPFSQGPVNFATACKNAKAKGITVNTIHCGPYQQGIDEQWKAGADLTGGIYMHIDHNAETVYIETPYDKQINQLNQQLNKTYIPYNQAGKKFKHNQITQDANSAQYSTANSSDRAAFKSSKKYKADNWDLVDKYKKDKSVINKANALPDSLSKLTPIQLEAKIQAITQQRAQIQESIQELDSRRRMYKAEKSKKLDQEGEQSLQKSILKSVRKQAKEKGYQIKE